LQVNFVKSARFSAAERVAVASYLEIHRAVGYKAGYKTTERCGPLGTHRPISRRNIQQPQLGMTRLLADYRVFWKEFRQNFHTTGAVLPSGRSLAMALSRYVRDTPGPRRVLEVGPGTGAVTTHIAAPLGPNDRLDLVELNDRFVQHLRERFATEPALRAIADRARVLHQRVEDLPEGESYDLIISGLPLNNFSVADVEQILVVLRRLLRRGGTLSFFEYIGVRPARALFSGAAERARLRGISRSLRRLLGEHEIRRDWVWSNVPPAWVHHVRWP
jgi:phospholipid N-methyltransferase